MAVTRIEAPYGAARGAWPPRGPRPLIGVKRPAAGPAYGRGGGAGAREGGTQMVELTTPAELLCQMLDRMRAVAHRNPREDDRSLRELEEEIDDLDEEHRHELVALLWVGRGVFEEGEWAEAVATAAERDTGPTSAYLLRDPLAPDEIAAGLEALGHDHVLGDGRF